MPPLITASVVSHGQNGLVNALVEDFANACPGRLSLVVTENIADSVPLELEAAPFPHQVLRNAAKKGFGANHNAAFRHCATPYFCVVNPDIRLRADPFSRLLERLDEPGIGVVGPLVRNPSGDVEDSARRFPTMGRLVARRLRTRWGPDYPTDQGPVEVDWLAGMFLLFRSETYRALGGFDERYFLYYEDVDICRRLARQGLKVLYEPRAEVIHDARRASRRNLRLAAHHLRSTARYMLGV